MKRLLFVAAAFAAICLLVGVCKTPTQKSSSPDNNVFANYASRETNTQTLLDLFYGMDKDSAGQYYCTELDTIKNLLHKEFFATWRNSEDSVWFNMCIGLYIDTVFPSEIVRNQEIQWKSSGKSRKGEYTRLRRSHPGRA